MKIMGTHYRNSTREQKEPVPNMDCGPATCTGNHSKFWHIEESRVHFIHWLQVPHFIYWLHVPHFIHWLQVPHYIHWLQVPHFIHWLHVPHFIHWLQVPHYYWLQVPHFIHRIQVPHLFTDYMYPWLQFTGTPLIHWLHVPMHVPHFIHWLHVPHFIHWLQVPHYYWLQVPHFIHRIRVPHLFTNYMYLWLQFTGTSLYSLITGTPLHSLITCTSLYSLIICTPLHSLFQVTSLFTQYRYPLYWLITSTHCIIHWLYEPTLFTDCRYSLYKIYVKSNVSAQWQIYRFKSFCCPSSFFIYKFIYSLQLHLSIEFYYYYSQLFWSLSI